MTTAQKAAAGLATTGIVGGVSAAATKKSPVEEELKIETEHQQPEEQKKEKPKVPEKKSKRHFKDKVVWRHDSFRFRNNLHNNIRELLIRPSTSHVFLEKLMKNLSVFHKDHFLNWGHRILNFQQNVNKTVEDISDWCRSKYDLESENEPNQEELNVFGEFCKPTN
ncbi:hypothetical protein [Candidatus Mycoplasma haematohominis]|uniref:Uncharacterized protein n=1 Tax=Candidatus Mycoplasma haematohominis TaxID=1494318 RepID=A0A478FSM1_9MOLU|nr:hypothetical protein [Candidatus Mycoplasma haemohominis]GCE63386.1 hypothetical protein MHSWG343_03820 [Candidatus Mycoplasma haemohominis]